jgi:uncharacterized membrane protein
MLCNVWASNCVVVILGLFATWQFEQQDIGQRRLQTYLKFSISVFPIASTATTVAQDAANCATDTRDGNGMACITILLISSIVAEHAVYAIIDWMTSSRFSPLYVRG